MSLADQSDSGGTLFYGFKGIFDLEDAALWGAAGHSVSYSIPPTEQEMLTR